MFRRRLTWFWILLTALALVILARLVQIQVWQRAQYEELAARILTRPTRYIRAPRGTVFDRKGRPLLGDAPSSDISIHYAVLAGREEYLLGVARALRKRGEYAAEMRLRDVAEDLRGKIGAMWQRLSELTGLSAAEFAARATECRERVDRIRRSVQQRSPTVRRIPEEDQLLPLLEDVDDETALKVQLELEGYPWLRVAPGSRRVAHQADALVHVLGRLGAASPELIAADPLHADELRGLRPGDRCGVCGVERLGETALRGARGRIVEDVGRNILERTDPVRGRDVYLTIDLELQQYVLARLQEAVEACTYPAGGAAVVIDVPSREIRALVSVPAYSFERFNSEYDALRRDTKYLPLTFRAVAAEYPPGSICKAICLVGGLSEGVITPQTTIECKGHLLPDKPNQFRCWIYNQHPGVTHGPQDAESAVRNSCNIYFFTVGQMLGPARLCEWFARFGLGRTTGTGLIEESGGIVPTEEWLTRNAGRRFLPADAWNFAIGQGELTCTPLQAANVAATIAAGSWGPVRLAYDGSGQALGAPPAPAAALDEEAVRTLRRGMWRVVNERGGTASDARLDYPGYELCGKTGSAQTVARALAWRYTCEWPDGQREEIVAATEEDALATFGDEKPRIVGHRAAERYPALLEGETLPAHAWFMGFVQPATTPRGRAPTGRVYAISVIIEFGGSGGRVAAPVAKQIAEYLLEQER